MGTAACGQTETTAQRRKGAGGYRLRRRMAHARLQEAQISDLVLHLHTCSVLLSFPTFEATAVCSLRVERIATRLPLQYIAWPRQHVRNSTFGLRIKSGLYYSSSRGYIVAVG